MAISDEDIQKVREASDIVALFSERAPVRQRGRNFLCCCPFHNEKTPSCTIDPARGLWHCFGCGEGGDVFAFIMKADDLSFPDAVRYLAERCHIELVEQGVASLPRGHKARLREVCKVTSAFYHEQLMRGKSSEAQAARSYLSGRHFGTEVSKTWGLGYAPGHLALVRHLSSLGFTAEEMIDANVAIQREGNRLTDRFFNRVMFPIADAQGNCIAFGGRIINEGEPKYLNSQDTPLFHKSNVLYGLDKAKAAMTNTGSAIVVEGYTDVISLHEGGITNAVATLGTALTAAHIRLLSRHASQRIVYLFDGDAAGQRAADRALQFITQDMTPESGRTRVELCAVTLPDDLDPADFVEKKGSEALKELIAGAQPLISFGIDRRLANHDLQSPEGRTSALADTLSVLAPIKDSLLAKDYAIQLASRLHMRESDVLDRLAHLKAPRQYPEQTYNSASASNGSTPFGASTSSQSQQASTGATPQKTTELSGSEKSRFQFEKRFLAVLAQNPQLASDYFNALAQTQWHNTTHALLAESIMTTLEKNPSASAAQIITEATQKVPRAAGMLTSATSDDKDLKAKLAFLSEELEIGDLEDGLVQMNADLKSNTSYSTEEREVLFNTIVEHQKTLAEKRAAHAPEL